MRHGVSWRMLRDATDHGRVRFVSVQETPSGGRTYTYDVEQLDEDLARLRCHYDGCERPGIGRTGRCARHAAEVRRPPAKRGRNVVCPECGTDRGYRKPSELAKMSTEYCIHCVSKQPDYRARASETKRAAARAQGLVEERACEWCGDLFQIPRCYLRNGWGRYCTHRCRALAHGAAAKQQRREVVCPGCGSISSRTASADAKAKGDYCAPCSAKQPERRARVSESRLATEARWDDQRRESGLLDAAAGQERFGLGPETIRAADRCGVLSAAKRHDDGRTKLYEHSDLVALVRLVARNEHHTARLWREDPDWVVEQYRARGWLRSRALRDGHSEEDAAVLLRRDVREASSLVLRHRAGRKPTTESRVWLEIAQCVLDDELDGDDIASLTPTGLASEVGLRDWQNRPEIWPRDRYPAVKGDPDSLHPAWREAAADRVRRRLRVELKALLTGRT